MSCSETTCNLNLVNSPFSGNVMNYSILPYVLLILTPSSIILVLSVLTLTLFPYSAHICMSFHHCIFLFSSTNLFSFGSMLTNQAWFKTEKSVSGFICDDPNLSWRYIWEWQTFGDCTNRETHVCCPRLGCNIGHSRGQYLPLSLGSLQTLSVNKSLVHTLMHIYTFKHKVMNE